MNEGTFSGYQIRELTFARIMAEKARKNGDRPYLTWVPDGRCYSYRDLESITNRLANGLAGLGVGRGTHVALLMENSPEHALLHFALGKLGAVAASINPSARGDLLRHFVNLSDATVMIVDTGLAPRFLEIQEMTPAVQTLIIHGEGDVGRAGGREIIRLSDLEQAEDGPVGADVCVSDPAKILFTSGTTGPSKGALYSQGKSLLYCLEYNAAYGICSTDTLYCWNPMFHLASFHSGLLTAYLADARVMFTNTFSVSRFWGDVRSTETTVVQLMGSTLNFLWDQPPSPRDRDHRARIGIVVPLPEFAVGFMERFGIELTSVYGLSDFGLLSVFRMDKDPIAKLGSCGRPVNDWQVRIVDDDDFEVPRGQTGEIVGRCDRPWSMPTGYYKNPQATVDTWRNGWFHTGDRGYMDQDGYIWYVGRSKDSIRRRGENISAYEVEQAIASHPMVGEVAAFAVKSELSEEEVAVVVVSKSGTTLTEPDLIEHCQRNLAYFMVPRFVRFASDLPRNANHKIEKYKLRTEAEANLGLFWDREKSGIVLRR